jgi:hypothetical protein
MILKFGGSSAALPGCEVRRSPISLTIGLSRIVGRVAGSRLIQTPVFGNLDKNLFLRGLVSVCPKPLPQTVRRVTDRRRTLASDEEAPISGIASHPR